MTGKQSQKAGDGSTNLQAHEITINTGLSYPEVKQVAMDVFDANFYRLQHEAAELAKSRAEKLVDNYLATLAKRNPYALESAKDPDMQYALFSAQKEYARSGDEDLAQLLIDILVDRAGISERNLLQIVLNESLSVAPKLTVSQIDALTIIFLVKHTRCARMGGLDALSDHLEQFYVPFIDHLTDKEACYQHMSFTGCATISIGDIKIERKFRDAYPGIFCRGLDDVQVASLSLPPRARKKLICQCLHNSKLWQINAVDGETIDSISRDLGIENDKIDAIKRMHKSTLLHEGEVKALLIEAHPAIEALLNLWDNSLMQNMILSSVGIAIAHANLRRKINEEFDLSIWIK